MQLNKGLISRQEALKISPAYVAFVEGNHDQFDAVITLFKKLKRGQKAISFHDGKFFQGKISSVNHNDFRAVDGPIVRFSNGEASWRVDGNRWAFPS